MAVMSAGQIDALVARWIRENREQIDGCSKANIRAVFVAVDQFLSDNAATMNAAIPQPGRGALSTSLKSSILSATSDERWGTSTQ